MARIAVVSDIHGNLEALAAVLEDAGRCGIEAVYSLGDIVGYGPDPAACLDIVRARAAVSLLGNHDAAVAGRTALEDFNPFARRALEWTAGVLDAPRLAYLAGLPYSCCAKDARYVHASASEPERWHYIHGLAELEEHFVGFGERLCFVGHTHWPGIFAREASGRIVRCPDNDTLSPARRYLVNAGSIGQPRDRDPRASYVLFDEQRGSLALRRVVYPVARTQERMRAAGSPAFLSDRLHAGV